MIGVYKITNLINNHAYIGISTNIEKRFQYHKDPYNHKRESNKLLYRAFAKYGIENFKFEILEECSVDILAQKEKYYITLYNTMKDGYNMTAGGEDNIGESHPGHKLTEADIIDIRTRYNNLERKKEVFQLYCHRIGESGFGKIWKGETWKSIMPEVYTKENRDYHALHTGNEGSTNGRACLTEQDVIDIRIRRKNGERLQDVYQDYKDRITKGSFTNIWSYQNWKNIVI